MTENLLEGLKIWGLLLLLPPAIALLYLFVSVFIFGPWILAWTLFEKWMNREGRRRDEARTCGMG